ncbi:MAG: GTP cyclohydrolase I FolE2 [Rhodanobacteraceae bacterium]|nr:GTP cyclohydrolase I FolE2 [Rhodanobacteraceae bacterium]HPF73233.1 GTP cyclohydrolase FolE2 [Xanthomonadaceae bacterium]HRX99878.1 GTP cyclohydrolase FolE2 [Xanthomonadaceae bacterium]
MSHPFDDNTVRKTSTRQLPDVASDARPQTAGVLDWVGMENIQMPVRIRDAAGDAQRSPARVTAQVSLDRPDTRGIHMSRLYLALDRLLDEEALSPCLIRRLLREFLDSHEGLSGRARLRIDFEMLLRRPALRSDNSGWRGYPITVAAEMDADGLRIELGLSLLYSSTCPASAALSREAIQHRFRETFGEGEVDAKAVFDWLGSEQGMAATPHSQRSRADLRLLLEPSFDDLPIAGLIDALEATLSTPVQTAVKRDDEQAFAELNAANTLFCEDAARRLQSRLLAEPRIADFSLRVAHLESLHAHDAVAEASRDGRGYRPLADFGME